MDVPIDSDPARPEAPTACTLARLRDCLVFLGLSEEETASSVIELVREGEVRLIGPYAETVSRVAGRAPRLH